MCGQAYDYHDNQKIRPKVQSAALIFGSALDKALSVLLTNGEDNPEAVFETSFRYNKIHDIETYIPTHPDLVYAAADFDAELLTPDDYNYLDEQIQAGKIVKPKLNWLDAYNEIKKQKSQSGLDSLSQDDRVFFNLMNWLSLKRKGFLMIKAYKEKILPKLEKVHSIQEYVSIENEIGDKIIGYVDLVADVKGVGTVILDNKTSSIE